MSIRSVLAQGVADLLGSRAAYPIATALAKAGLRGLGVNVSYQFDQSGESWLLHRIFEKLVEPSCIDVGANVGEFTVRTLKLGASRVVAFEPVPKTFEVLSRAVKSDRRATLVQSAVGNVTGAVEIFVPSDEVSSVLASLDRTLIPGGHDTGATPIQVPMTRLDDCDLTNRQPFDILKIDVEGFELEVLQGASRLLQTFPPKFIQFEFNSHHALRRHTIRDFSLLLPDYKLFRLAASSLRPLDVDHYLSTIYTFQNIVCVHESALHLLGA